MEMQRYSRRTCLWGIVAGLVSLERPGYGQDAPVEYFEAVRWFERKPGSATARILEGKLMVNRREEKVAFFAEFSNRFESPFAKIKGLSYEYAKRPSGLIEPVPEGQKPFHRAQRHLLVLKYQDRGGYFKEEILELHKSNFGEVLRALEYATGLETKRP